ncbi:ser/thr protein kinase [Reticulomyxa filosa]|uniref:Ser/thr protein kinase n=1 Tax=Reticulomyxa filosa TaxID=46433 RepID=X6MBJ0_RETFI|nr:ser/thr protein kinase [Reticulomyxa filosa]|eukprot:ETO10380.1 ser/thr protein kinase [Reticulomyxa filosa]
MFVLFFFYKKKKVYARKEYSPEKADIWCLGVMLFMMLVGAPPYQVPDPSNPAFRFLVNGRLRDVLVHWKRLPLIPADALDVMSKIFKPESQRISMKDLRLHKFVGLSDKTTTDDKADALNLSSPLVAQDKNVDALSNANNNEDNINANANNSNGVSTLNNSGNDEKKKKLTIKKEHIPWMKTKQAQDMAQQLQHITQVDDMHTFIQNTQSIIDHLSNVSKNLTDHHHSHTTPLVDHSCLHELQLLLEFAKNTLEGDEADPTL